MAVLAWYALIFALSSVPGRDLPEMPAQNADKFVHAAVYAVLGALCLRALRRSFAKLQAPVAAVCAVALATLFGVSDELHQLLTPGRSADPHDVMADAIGAVIGALVVLAIGRLRLLDRGARRIDENPALPYDGAKPGRDAPRRENHP